LVRNAHYLLIALLLCVLGYLAGANAFLRFNGISLLFKSTNSVNATYRSAYTLWPGVVHINDLRIVFQDHNLQFSLDIKQAKARIVLWELLRRRFHVKWVDGAGAAFRMRHRIQPESRTQPWVSALPPIPEFPAPAVFEPRAPEPPIPDSEYSLWTVHLENVNVAVTEVWVQFVRFVGEGRARGAFRLVPARTLWVAPSTLDLGHGRVHFGRETIASQVAGRISCKVDFFDVRLPQGAQVFRFISSDIALQAKAFLLDPLLQFFVPREIQVSSKPADLTADIHVSRGRVSPGTKVRYSTDEVTATRPPLVLQAKNSRVLYDMVDPNTAVTRLDVATASLDPDSAVALESIVASLTASGSDLTGDFSLASETVAIGRLDVIEAKALNQLFGEKLPVTFEGGAIQASLMASNSTETLVVDAEVPHVDLRASIPDLGMDVRGAFGITGHRTQGTDPNLQVRAWAKFKHLGVTRTARRQRGTRATLGLLSARGSYREDAAQRALEFEASSASLLVADVSDKGSALQGQNFASRGALTGRGRLLTGAVTAQLESLQLRSEKTILSLKPSLHLALLDGNQERRTGKLHADLQLVGWNATYGDDGGQCSSLVIPTAHLEASASFAERWMSATLRGTLERLHFDWGGDFRAVSDLQIDSHWSGTDLQRPSGLQASARLLGTSLVSGRGGDRSGWEVAMPEVTVEVKAKRHNQVVGSLSVGIKEITGRIGSTRMKAHLDAGLPRFRLDLNNQSAVLDGQVRLSDGHLHSGKQRIDGWWAAIDVQSAQLLARQNLDLSAYFRGSLRDATPVLVLLADGHQVPSWLSDSLPLSEISVRGQAARQCRLTMIRFDHASGGPLTARGTLQSTSELVRGAILVRLAALQSLSVGLEVGPPDAGISLLAGDEWLAKRTEMLDNAARQILSSPCHNDPQHCAPSSLARSE
jgi:hypothetical protein